MGNIFNFLSEAPYEERKVDRYEKGDLLVDTCSMSDAEHPVASICFTKL